MTSRPGKGRLDTSIFPSLPLCLFSPHLFLFGSAHFLPPPCHFSSRFLSPVNLSFSPSFFLTLSAFFSYYDFSCLFSLCLVISFFLPFFTLGANNVSIFFLSCLFFSRSPHLFLFHTIHPSFLYLLPLPLPLFPTLLSLYLSPPFLLSTSFIPSCLSLVTHLLPSLPGLFIHQGH